MLFVSLKESPTTSSLLALKHWNFVGTLLFILCDWVICLCVHMHHMLAWCPLKPEKSIRSLETGVTKSCKPPLGFWESNLSPLQEQQIFLATESSLQPTFYSFLSVCSMVLNYIWDIRQPGCSCGSADRVLSQHTWIPRFDPQYCSKLSLVAHYCNWSTQRVETGGPAAHVVLHYMQDAVLKR